MKPNFYSIFSLTSLALFGIEFLLTQNDQPFTRMVTMCSTLFLALITFLSFYFTHASIMHENPNKFIRGVMAGTMIKFFACIAGVTVLLFTLKKELHKPDLFLLMFVYMIYATIEAVTLSKLNKK
jgi:hypothetical protein